MRTIIIGDIHGCYDEFISLLKKIQYKKKKDKLILLGDLMDRGPKSWEMLQIAMRLKKECPESFYMIRGNHDQYILEEPLDMEMSMIWWAVGKEEMKKSFKKHKDDYKKYAGWIEENMKIYHEEDLFRCVHAAIEKENFEENPVDLLVKDHGYSKKNLYSGKLTIIGHTPLEGPTYYDGSGNPGEILPYHTPLTLPQKGAICIDTGCVYLKKLTAMIIEEDTYTLDYVDGPTKVTKSKQHYIKWIKKFCNIVYKIRGIEYDRSHQ